MSKVVKNPQAIKVKTKNSVKRSQGFNGSKPAYKKNIDRAAILRQQGKLPGSGLDDYTLDLMKLS